MPEKTPMEMFAELTQWGFVRPARIEPTSLMVPTGYISVPTTLAFASPPIPGVGRPAVGTKDAKLGTRSKRNSKRKGQRRVCWSDNACADAVTVG
jgi:hypothetical protein